MKTQSETGAVAGPEAAAPKLGARWKWVVYVVAGGAIVLALKYLHVQDVLKEALD